MTRADDGARGVIVARPKSDNAVKKSETRQLTELVAVRCAPGDLDVLRSEANRRGITVQQLLRDSSLGSVRAAS